MIRANVSVTNSRPSLTLITGQQNTKARTEATSVSTASRQKQEVLHELATLPDDAILSQATLTNSILTLSQNPTSSGAPILVVPSSLSYLLGVNTQKAEDTMAIKRNHTNNNNSTDGSSFSDDDDSSLDETSSFKLLRADVAVDYSRSSFSSSPTSDKQQSVKTGPRRHTGPRKPRAYEKLTPEEEERRRVRRERNKHAAAKCRQKRVDLTNSLLAETEKLQSEQLKLQNEIKEFQREKDELEFILEAHRLHCGVSKSNGISIGIKPEIKTDDEVVVEDEETVTTTVVVSTKSAVSRPTTLSTNLLSSLSTSTTASNQVAGIAITTPTTGLNVFTLGLESMMDGHTGLTPITGLPVAFAGLSTPVVIAGISGSQILLAGGGNTHQILAEETVSTPCNGDAAVSELM